MHSAFGDSPSTIAHENNAIFRDFSITQRLAAFEGMSAADFPTVKVIDSGVVNHLI